MAQWLTYLLMDQLPLVQITAPEFFTDKTSNVAVLIDSTLLIQWTVEA